jgi:pyrimidine operon attenuation protein / uracil phosphoribosyltransferase
MPLPDAELLLRELIGQMRPQMSDNSALVGIHTGGAWLAERLHRELKIKSPLGSLDVSFYRDDYGKIGLHPQLKATAIPFEVSGRDIILVDDVLYTGRTIRAAMNVLFDYGRPERIRLAALVDRGGRQLPIAPQFVGTTLNVTGRQMLVLEKNEQGRLKLKFEHEQQ